MELKTRRKVILVGDKVLMAPDADSEKSAHGLYLPAGVREKEKIQSGMVVTVGPGYAVPNPHFIDQESWSNTFPCRPRKETMHSSCGTPQSKWTTKVSGI